MDGELCSDEADILLDKIKSHPEMKQDWLTYHLIGDALRQPDYIPAGLKTDFLERLHAEPTVLAPQRKYSSQARFFALSAAASIMAIAFLAWLSVQIDGEPLLQQQPGTLQAASFPSNADFRTNDNMNDYLLAHHELSPGSEIRSPASYIRRVAFEQAGAGR